MNSRMPGSVIPTMITPFTKENEIDYDAVEVLVEYYIEKKCTGIFALCQSSETFFLTLAEKQALIRFILRLCRKPHCCHCLRAYLRFSARAAARAQCNGRSGG